MASRKVKHAAALAKRAKFMTTVKEGNLNVLSKVRDQREEEKKRIEKEVKDRQIKKSKMLAAKHGKSDVAVQTQKPMKKGRSTLAKLAGKDKKS